jgi:hypothetical protein
MADKASQGTEEAVCSMGKAWRRKNPPPAPDKKTKRTLT